jgi:hypothetical protein
MMIDFTDQGTAALIHHVQEALDEVAGLDEATRLRHGNWTSSISEAIKRRILGPGMECAFGRDRTKREDEREWLFDFCALLFEEESRNGVRFVAQAAIIGEIEFSDPKGLDKDFEKLLIVDSLACFFAFPKWSETEARAELDRFEHVVERRQRYAKLRGASRPPVFLLSCYLAPSRRFMHRIVGLMPTSPEPGYSDESSR